MSKFTECGDGVFRYEVDGYVCEYNLNQLYPSHMVEYNGPESDLALLALEAARQREYSAVALHSHLDVDEFIPELE